MNYTAVFDNFKEARLSGRYITNTHIEPLLRDLNSDFKTEIIGRSVLEKPIYRVAVGSGSFKVLLWSQMHGNESTTTKALFDLFRFLNSDDEEALRLKKQLTLYCIPILNPDGAELYTRVNANEVDLNRDSIALTQPESGLLRHIFETFKPDFCFNLHDQRSIFGVGETKLPATVSFLAPAYDEDRKYNACRLKAVSVINVMNDMLQKFIPGQIGRFDDVYNGNCIGDQFQSLGVPTVLIEAGHFQEDYEREQTRKFIFFSYLSGLMKLSENVVVEGNLKSYLDIPQNKSSFYDFVYKKFKICANSLNIITNFAAQYTEKLIAGKVVFEAKIIEVGETIDRFGHYEFDGDNGVYSDDSDDIPQVDQNANFILNETLKFVNGLPVS